MKRLLLILLLVGSCASAQPKKGGIKIVEERASAEFPNSYVFHPGDGLAHPGIILLHGSNGGSIPGTAVHAALLAARGFSVMTFCWWDCDRNDVRIERMPYLARIELTRTVAALKWFKESRFVGADHKLGLYGISMGAEQALLLASLNRKITTAIDAVAVHAVNDVTSAGMNFSWLDERCWTCDMKAKGCTDSESNWNPRCGPINLENESPWRLPLWLWEGEKLKIGQRIEIEQFEKPLLITHGEKDTVWNVQKAKNIDAKMKEVGRKPEVILFPNEGHGLSMPAEQERRARVESFFLESLQ